MSKQYKIGDVIDVSVQKIVPRGFGLAFAEKLTVLIPLTAPGDEVRVRIREIKKRLAFAEVVEVLRPGPNRAVPPCVYFGQCGGCDFQQMSYAAQLDAKVGIIRDCLHRIGKIEYDAEIPIIPSPDPLNYRSRARWHLDRREKTIGYYARDSHHVVDIKACPILSQDLQSTLESVRENTEWGALWGDQAQIETASGDDAVSIYSADMAEQTAEVAYEANGERYVFSAETFFQANKILIPDLIEAALGETGGDTAFDLYCGIGLFTLSLGRRFENVIGVEENPIAVEFARKNIAGAGLLNVKIVNKSVGAFLAENQKKRLDLILIDPPRSGTEKHTIQAIARLRPAEISYVSCEPSILARDLRILIDAGYRIDSMTALDLFPQTHHVETVVRLSRNRDGSDRILL